MIGCGCGHYARSRAEIKVEQKIKQKGKIDAVTRFSLRVELVAAIRAEQYKPVGDCPKCGRELTVKEILKGFNTDPTDFTTECSGCRERFQPRLILISEGASIELPFFCDAQTLAQMNGLEVLAPEVLAREHPAIYRAAIAHHGSISAALKKIGKEYKFEEISDWKNKIRPFFGKMPDTIIAECVGVSASVIRRLRKKAKVKAFGW